MQPLPGFETSFAIFHKSIPAIKVIFEGHDGDLDPRAVQPPQPLRLRLVAVAEVEARGEDPQTQVGVPSEEVCHVTCTVVAGAPRREPGDTVAPARVQVPVGDVTKEEQFHVAPGLVSKVPEVQWEGGGTIPPLHHIAQVGLVAALGPAHVFELVEELPLLHQEAVHGRFQSGSLRLLGQGKLASSTTDRKSVV